MTLYSIKELADVAQVSKKTLRYYDQIGLLPPHSYSDKGYRLYSEKEVTTLHHILLYKELGLSLKQIAAILAEEQAPLALLERHKYLLETKQRQLEELLTHVSQSIHLLKGGHPMTIEETFDSFQSYLEANQEQNGALLRESYGTEVVDQSFATMSNFTRSKHIQWRTLEQRILTKLAHYLAEEYPTAEATDLFTDHQEWLTMSWGAYSVERHLGLAQLYLITPEFTSYYDSQAGAGATNYLVAVITAQLDP